MIDEAIKAAEVAASPKSPPAPEVFGREAVVVDPHKPQAMSKEVHQSHLMLAAEKAQLETNVQYCLSAGIEWLEVSRELLTHLCGNKFPDERYMIYKNVRLCLAGEAEGIAQRERLTVHEILFPKDGFMYVGKGKK